MYVSTSKFDLSVVKAIQHASNSEVGDYNQLHPSENPQENLLVHELGGEDVQDEKATPKRC